MHQWQSVPMSQYRAGKRSGVAGGPQAPGACITYHANSTMPLTPVQCDSIIHAITLAGMRSCNSPVVVVDAAQGKYAVLRSARHRDKQVGWFG